ncbi:MAG TPA: HEAT repeat domain-containing protein [Kofleriaceae bacterium]|jgi:hypothetical protein
MRGPIALCIVVAALIGLAAQPARADNVDDLIGQLENGDSAKVRLAAALNLTKLGDPKAVLALAKALGGDSDKNVRGAAAVGLGKLGPMTKGSARNIAQSSLQHAADSDESDFVKQQAGKALAAMGGGSSVTSPTAGGAIYVNIGPMSSRTGSPDDPKYRELMVKTAGRTLGRVASDMATTWPGGLPTKAQLAAKSAHGFYVDGTLNELKVKTTGASSIVSCKISMLLASFPDKAVFGLLSGGASVQASASPTDIALAQTDCVSAVVEDLIGKKIVPTIKSKAAEP